MKKALLKKIPVIEACKFRPTGVNISFETV